MRTTLIIGILASLAGCGVEPTTTPGTVSEALGASKRQPMPSCGAVQRPAALRHVTIEEHGNALVTVLVEGTALCLDTFDGALAAGLFPSGGTELMHGNGQAADSPSGTDPMPAKGNTQGNTSTDPMPADVHQGGN